MYGDKKVSIVFPAYNEEEGILEAIVDFSSCSAVDEIIVVNNNSTDRTAEQVAKTSAILIHEAKQGYGYALRRGMREATGDLIILAEPDGTFIGRDIHKLLAYCDDFEMVMGTRTAKELIWRGANMGWSLRMGNVVVAKMLEWLFGGPCLTDCGCTMRLISQEAKDKIQDQLTVGGSHFLPEMVILALLHRIPIIEIPVNYRGRLGDSKITGSMKTAIKVGWRMICLILSYRVRTLLRKDAVSRPLPVQGREFPAKP